MRTITLKIEKELTAKNIADIVITAFEGGSNYWCGRADTVELTASGWHSMSKEQHASWRDDDGCGPYANPEFWESDERDYRLHDEYENEAAPIVLTSDKIALAIQKLADHENPGWQQTAARLMEPGDYDADDADVAIQMAVFDDVVYG